MTAETVVAVAGGGRCSPEEARMAEEVGRRLARRGCTVLCGGLGGVMEAACRGARGEGGRTIGILPTDSPRHANPYVDIAIATGLGEARNAVIVHSAQAVIAVGGEYGTLSEIAFALKKGLPVIGLGTWSLAKAGRSDPSIIACGSPEEAVETALAQIARRASGE